METIPGLKAINHVLKNMSEYFHQHFGAVTGQYVFIYDIANLYYKAKDCSLSTLSSFIKCEMARVKNKVSPKTKVLHIFVNSRFGWATDADDDDNDDATALLDKENIKPPPATSFGKRRWVHAVATLKTGRTVKPTTAAAFEAALPTFEVHKVNAPSSAANLYIVQNFCEFPQPTGPGRCGHKLLMADKKMDKAPERVLYDKFHEVDDYLINLLRLLFTQNGNEVNVRSFDLFRSNKVQFVADGQQGFKLEPRAEGGLKNIYAAALMALRALRAPVPADDVYYSAASTVSTVSKKVRAPLTRKNSRNSRNNSRNNSGSKKGPVVADDSEEFFSASEGVNRGGHQRHKRKRTTQKSWWHRLIMR